MIKLFHLSTCSTCQRIIKELNLPSHVVLQDIKTNPVVEADLNMMKEAAGSYEAIFSKRAMKYRGMGLHQQTLTEADYKKLILQEYTFLKRPVLFVNDQVFIGNSKKTVASAITALQSQQN